MKGLLFHLSDNHPYARFERQDEYIEDWRAICTTFEIDVLVCIDATARERAEAHMWVSVDTAFEFYPTLAEAVAVWRGRGAAILGFEQERHNAAGTSLAGARPIRADDWLAVLGPDEGGFNSDEDKRLADCDSWHFIPVPNDKSLWAQQAAAIIGYELSR